jgi:hypothetical protein
LAIGQHQRDAGAHHAAVIGVGFSGGNLVK